LLLLLVFLCYDGDTTIKLNMDYGPSNQWQNFDGDERKFEVWETKILGYFKLKKLKDTLVGTDDVDADKNDTAFAELIQFLDERSLSPIIRKLRMMA